MSGSLYDLRRLTRKTQDLPAEWENTHREGRNRQAWLKCDIILVYTFMFLLILQCVNKEQLVFAPSSPPLSYPLPHIHYYDFLLPLLPLLQLHHHQPHAQTLQTQRRVEAEKMGSEGKREGASVMHCQANLKTRKLRPSIKKDACID